MNTNKSKNFLNMYIEHLKSNIDYNFIIENILDFLDNSSRVYLKSKKDFSTLKIVNKDQSIFILEVYPNIFDIQNADLKIINRNSIIDYKLCYENNDKYFTNRISFYEDDVIVKDIIEMFKNNTLFYKLEYDKEINLLKEFIINKEIISVKTSSDNELSYSKYINEQGKYVRIDSNKREFIRNKSNIFNDSYNELRKSM